jgi:hypothetical protein
VQRRAEAIGALDDYPYLVEIATKLPESGYDNAVEFAWGLISSSTGLDRPRPASTEGLRSCGAPCIRRCATSWTACIPQTTRRCRSWPKGMGLGSAVDVPVAGLRPNGGVAGTLTIPSSRH